jgi:hypothetical protein
MGTHHPGNILLHGIASVMVLLLGRALFVDKVRIVRSCTWPYMCCGQSCNRLAASR